jgi:asparagine synthase (glutamine-hydrolysing)
MDVRYFVRRDETVFRNIEAIFAATGDIGLTFYLQKELYDLVAGAGARLVMDGLGGDYTVNVRARAMLGRILRRGHLMRFVREFRARRRMTGRTRSEVWRHDVLPALLPSSVLAGAHAFPRHGFMPVWKRRPVQAAFAQSLFASGKIDRSRLRRDGPARDRWQARWLQFLHRSADAVPIQSILAASRGLEFTRPFHDKRIVEFAMAVPEELHFKNGLERYLARQAFHDCLPERLLASGPGNDSYNPDMFRMAMGSAPAALAKARLQDRDGRLSRYVDFTKLERMLADLSESRTADHQDLSFATNAIAFAQFLAWFDRSNA